MLALASASMLANANMLANVYVYGGSLNFVGRFDKKV